ncbi:major factor subunit, partial [Bifidobacterium bifidum IPLA 20015]
MPRITRYWAHDPIGNSEGILAGYEPAALKAAQDRGIIFIAELDDGTRLRV